MAGGTDSNVVYVAPDVNGTLKKVEGQLVDVVEKKVSTAGTASLLSAAAVSALGLYVLHGVVPDWLVIVIDAVVTGAVTWFSAFLAKHTSRVVVPSVVPQPIDPLGGGAGDPDDTGSHRAG
jgi:hypothetical protein